MDIAQIVTIPVITAIVYGAIEIYKLAIKGKEEKYNRFIPLIASVLGTILGIVGFYFAPDVVLADNILIAILLGGMSGLSATGAHQFLKQLKNKDEQQQEDKEQE